MKRILTFLLPVLLLFACGRQNDLPSPDVAFSEYIAAYTAGNIARTSSITLVLNADHLKANTMDAVPSPDWFDISPKVEGTLAWKNDNVLVFQPTEWLASGQAYKIAVDLDAFLDVPKDLSSFQFGFRTFEQTASVALTGLGMYDDNQPELQFFSGRLSTGDAAVSEVVESAFSAKQSGKKLGVTWVHEDNRTHLFTIDSIARKIEEGQIQITWDSEVLGTESDGIIEERVRGLNDFELVRTNIVQQPDQHLSLLFSDPVDASQSLNGLILIDDAGDVRFDISGNEIKVYPSSRKTGTAQLEISQNLKNKYGYQLKEAVNTTVTFESLKPAVRFLQTDKVILPEGNKNSVAFEAVSLSAVDVRIIRIFEDNVHQFLQVNELDQEQEIKRVGRLVKKKTIHLNPEGNIDLGVWNRFYLDLSDYIAVEQGAIYRIEMGFRKAHSLFPCDESDEEDSADNSDIEDWDTDSEGENSFWDYFDNYYYSAWDDYYYDYDYAERDNPCHSMYYRQNRFDSRNILATNLGIITKRGTDGIWNAWVTDLTSAAPLSGVNVELTNFQGQVIGQATTDSEGAVKIDAGGKVPFLIQAERGNEKTYMKLANGNALSLSRFDVSGESTQNGSKGYIYGERGVWRPGDTLFLGFMLENKIAKLPVGHPVQLEIIDARNQVIEKITRPLTIEQHLAFAIPTNADAATGNWQARIRIGSSIFNKWLKVETIKPNRLKIGLDFGKEKIKAGDKGMVGDLHVEWLHGAPAKNLRTSIEMSLKPVATQFKKFTDYVFDDPARDFRSDPTIVFDQEVSSTGDALVRVDLGTMSDAPGMLKAVFDTRAFESAGDFSIDQHSIEIAPYNSFVGIRIPKGDKARNMLLTDTTHSIQVVTVDVDGNPVARPNLKWSLHKVQWRWWWQGSDNDLGQYSGDQSNNRVDFGTLSTNSKGQGAFDIRVDYPSWGRYLLRVVDGESGHATGKTFYIDWPGWAGRAQRENPEGETMLMLSTDKTNYKTGDMCTVSFPGSKGARALVTVENGSQVISASWIETTEGTNTYQFKLAPEFAPNVFVNVELVQPHAQTINDNPMRMYGVTRILVENSASKLEPVISMPNELEPESVYAVKVSEKNGKEMSYTLAVVDEGLLGLTRFKTPNPHGYFYANEALGVNTWDVYDDVIGAYGAEMTPLLGIGGDEDQGTNGKKNANRFKPVVTYLGPFLLKKGASQTHEIQMPNYIGAVRVMVVARKEAAYGHAEKSVPVKKPLMVLATLPRVLGPAEDVELPITLFAMDEKLLNKDIKIEVETDDMLTGLTTLKRTISFSSLGEQVEFFKLRTAENIGITKINVTVSGGGERASYQMELDVRNPNPPATVRYTAALLPGESWEQTYDLPGMAGTNEIILETSTLRPINLGERLSYLIGYPHGCAEQTTSKAFPQLFLEDVVELTEQQKTRIQYNVQEAIDKLRSFQQSNGGFSYWPNQTNVNDYVTSYIGHFLIEAKEHGYNVPESMLEQMVRYQKELARNWRTPRSMNDRYYGYDVLQAYRLYTLALADKPDIGAMNRLREQSGLNVNAKWRLAACYHLIGQHEAGEALVKNVTHIPTEHKGTYYYYGSYYRELAMIAESLVRSGQLKKATELVDELAKNLNGTRWLSTQVTSYSLIAIGKYLQTEKGKTFTFSFDHNRQPRKQIQSDRPIVKVDLTPNQLAGNTFSLVNTGEKTVFVQLTTLGQPVEDHLPAAQEGIEMSTTYLDREGNRIDVNRLTQGTDIIAKVVVRNNSWRNGIQDIALTHVFPSGWEILNDRMLTAGAERFSSSQFDYQDVRDDRVLTYFNLHYNESKTFYVRLNAAYLGRFFLPATSVEAMYDGNIQARETGRWIEVVPEGVL